MKKIIIKNIRNINYMEFIIPEKHGVYIITGKNGVGKTTLFTCLSRICNNNAYRNGFPATNLNNYDVYTGSISYYIENENVTYTRRKSGRWQPDINKKIFDLFKYKSVIHIKTKDERIFTQVIDVPKGKISDADMWIINAMNDILSTDRFRNMRRVTVGDLRSRNGNAFRRRRNTAFVIPLENNTYYSEQNFSFGEIVLLNLLYDIKNVENESLVLIDELELALHPAAQIRLIEYLKDLSEKNNLTVLISTHSASIIKMQKDVILLEKDDEKINVYYNCPPAKSIGAIGMREDTMPDIIAIVEDDMAKFMLSALIKKYNESMNTPNFLDIRILSVGGYSNVIDFYIEANSYVFYDNTYFIAYLDNDVKTDVFDYPNFVNSNILDKYNVNKRMIKFLPFTPEILLYKQLKKQKSKTISYIREAYNNQLAYYCIDDVENFENYDSLLTVCNTAADYEALKNSRGKVRNDCKKSVKKAVESLSDQLNATSDELYRLIFKISIEDLCNNNEIDIRASLFYMMNR